MNDSDTNKKIINFLAPQIKKWAKDGKKIIVGIEGKSGSGKTALSFLLGREFENSCRLSLDMFNKRSPNSNKDYLASKNEFSSLLKDNYDLELLETFFEIFRNSQPGDILTLNLKGRKFTTDLNKQIMFFDGMFLKSNDAIGKFIGKRIIIDLDNKTLIMRRQGRANQKREANNNSGNFSALDTAWNKYIEYYQPEKGADVVLNLDFGTLQ